MTTRTEPHAPASIPESACPSMMHALAAMGPGPLDEASLIRHIHPLFSRVLKRREIYLANHSLGRPLDQTAHDVQRALDAWYDDMDGAWELWVDEMHRFRAGIARLIGCSRSDAIIPKPGAGQGLRAVLNALPNPRGGGHLHRVVSTLGEFDSIDFILRSYVQRGRISVDWTGPSADGVLDGGAIASRITKATDLVVVSHVYFQTGRVIQNLEAIVSAAKRAGALVLLDMYHSAGVLPLSMEELDVDFAIGGSYKYIRGGPGAGWLAIHPRHLDSDSLVTLDTGWFAKRDVFGFHRAQSDGDAPPRAEGGDGWLECTPAVLQVFQARAGLALTLGLGVDRLRTYSLEQQRFLRDKLDRCGVQVESADDDERGAFLCTKHPDARQACEDLKHAGINVDVRGSFCRLCPDILNTREELARACEVIGRVWRGHNRVG